MPSAPPTRTPFTREQREEFGFRFKGSKFGPFEMAEPDFTTPMGRPMPLIPDVLHPKPLFDINEFLSRMNRPPARLSPMLDLLMRLFFPEDSKQQFLDLQRERESLRTEFPQSRGSGAFTPETLTGSNPEFIGFSEQRPKPVGGQ